MTPDDDFTREHEHEHRDEGEWVSNEPPVDDFGDENATEAATVSEGDDHETEDQSEAGIEEKKGFPLMLLFGAIASLAVVGGLAYWHFGSHNDQQPSLLDQAQNGAHEVAPNFIAKTPVEGAETKSQAAVISTTPAPPPAAPTTAYSVPTVTVDIPEKNASQGSAVPAAPVAPVPPSVQAAAPVVAEQPAAAKTVQPEAAAVDDERVNALSARMDDLQKSLGQTVQQLGQINDKLSASAMGAGKPDAAVEERLDRLEQKITQLQQAAKPTDLVLPAQRKPVAEISPEAMPAEPAPITTKKPRHAMAAETKHGFAFRHHKLAPASSKFANNRWVLRAATPDEAWIAKNAETRELRPVHVGDTIDGVGRITAIEQVGATWVVQGTHGTIR